MRGVLHHQIQPAVLQAAVMNWKDVRVRELSEEGALVHKSTLEAPHLLRTACNCLRMDDLYSHQPVIHIALLGEIALPAAAGAEPPEQAAVAKGAALQPHRRRCSRRWRRLLSRKSQPVSHSSLPRA